MMQVQPTQPEPQLRLYADATHALRTQAHAAQAPVTDLQNVHDAVTVDLLNERVAYLEAKLKEAQAPQQAAPAVPPIEYSRFLTDVLTAAGLVAHGKQCKAIGERLGDMVMRLRAAPQQEAQEPYPIDADPQGIRAIVADAITGAPAFGAQGSNPPPEGHWLTPFWEMAREEAMRTQPASVSSDTLYLLRRLLSNQHTLTGSEFRAELGKIVEDAHAATPPAQPAPSGDVSKSGEESNMSDTELLDFICDNDRQRMVEQSGGFWRVYQDEAPLEAEHHLWQSMTSRRYSTAREAISAARKEGK